MAAPPERWLHADLFAIKEKYRDMLLVFVNHPKYLAILAELVGPTEIDSFASAFVHIFQTIGKGRLLPAIKALVEQDFLVNLHQPSTIMRGNCAASKMQTIFCKKEGKDYLQYVLGDFLRQVVADTAVNGLDFNIDNSRASPEAVAKNLQALLYYSKMMIERILDPEMREAMPRPIRAIAAITAELCRQYYPEGLIVLVGGFINLRFFSPAICVPWSYGLMSHMPSDKARRNLVMLGKVLQAISNGFVNTKKEPYLLAIEDFVMSYTSLMSHYLSSLGVDIRRPGAGDSGASRNFDISSSQRPKLLRALSNNSSNSDEPWADLFTAPVLAPNDVDLLNFELDELLTMHRVLYLAKKKFIGRLGQELIAVNNAAKEQQQTPQSGSPQYSSNPLPGQRPTLGVNPTLRASAQSGQDLEGYDQQQQGYMNQQQPQAGRGILPQPPASPQKSLTLSAPAGGPLSPGRALPPPQQIPQQAVPGSANVVSPRQVGVAPSTSTGRPTLNHSMTQLQQQNATGNPRPNALPPPPPAASNPRATLAPGAIASAPPGGMGSPSASTASSPRAPTAKVPNLAMTNPTYIVIHRSLQAALSALGPPPPAAVRAAKSETETEYDVLSVSTTVSDLEGVTQQQAQQYAALSFFYLGKPNKKAQPVFYLIAARLSEAILDTELRSVVAYVSSEIKRVIGEKTMSPYAIVLDTSWSHFGSKFATSILTKFREIADYNLRKRLANIYLVHPTPLVSQLTPLLKSLFPGWNKLIMCYEWKALEEHFAPGAIMLPAETQGFITKAFFVTKVNNKGKRQLRIIKFTSNSLLNIDPKSRSLQNEKLLSDIEHIELPSAEEIKILFSEPLASEKDKGKKKDKKEGKSIFGSSTGNSRDRHYICKSRQERDQVMEEIFRICFYGDTLKWPLEYQVIKVEGGLKANLAIGATMRTYKVTLDSLLILDNNSIKKELPLLGLKSIALGMVDDQPIALKLEFHEGLGSRGRTKIIVCRSPEQAKALKQLLEHQARIAHLSLS